jgi:hypothetical protein
MLVEAPPAPPGEVPRSESLATPSPLRGVRPSGPASGWPGPLRGPSLRSALLHTTASESGSVQQGSIQGHSLSRLVSPPRAHDPRSHVWCFSIAYTEELWGRVDDTISSFRTIKWAVMGLMPDGRLECYLWFSDIQRSREVRGLFGLRCLVKPWDRRWTVSSVRERVHSKAVPDKFFEMGQGRHIAAASTPQRPAAAPTPIQPPSAAPPTPTQPTAEPETITRDPNAMVIAAQMLLTMQQMLKMVQPQ